MIALPSGTCPWHRTVAAVQRQAGICVPDNGWPSRATRASTAAAATSAANVALAAGRGRHSSVGHEHVADAAGQATHVEVLVPREGGIGHGRRADPPDAVLAQKIVRPIRDVEEPICVDDEGLKGEIADPDHVGREYLILPLHTVQRARSLLPRNGCSMRLAATGNALDAPICTGSHRADIPLRRSGAKINGTT